MCGEKYVSKEHNVTCNLNVTLEVNQTKQQHGGGDKLTHCYDDKQIFKVKSILIG